MTIDAKDYEPRPADDFIAIKHPALRGDFQSRFHAATKTWLYHAPRMRSLAQHRTAKCHQLGCNFNDLPHG